MRAEESCLIVPALVLKVQFSKSCQAVGYNMKLVIKCICSELALHDNISPKTSLANLTKHTPSFPDSSFCLDIR